MITFVATVLLGGCHKFLSQPLYLHYLVYMFMYSDFTSRVTSKPLFGMFFTLSNFWRKSVVSLTYKGRWRRWLEMKINVLWNIVCMQFTELNTGHPRFPVLFIFGQVQNFGISGCCTWSPLAMFSVINLWFLKRYYVIDQSCVYFCWIILKLFLRVFIVELVFC